LAVDGGDAMPRKRVDEPKSTVGRQRRGAARLQNKIHNTSGGRFSMCESCGATFEQIWREEYKNYTLFKTCGNCRMANARGVGHATIAYTPHPSQQLIHASPARFKLLACLPPGEIILGSNMPIGELSVGDQVFGNNGEANKVYRTFERDYIGDLYEINARYILPFQVTDEHPVLLTRFIRNDNSDAYKNGRRPKKTEWRTMEEKWVKAANVEEYLTSQDKYTKWCLKIPRLKAGPETTKWKLRELKCCKSYYRPYFPINQDTAWAIGLFVAEGNLCRSSVQYGLGAHERNLIDEVKRIFTELGYHCNERTNVVEHSTRVTITSTALSEVFREKINVMSDNVQIPDDILLHPDKSIIISFLRGYFDGDGCVHEEAASIGGKTASRKLAMQLQLLIARLGFAAHITKTIRKKTSKIRGREISNKLPAYEVRCSSSEFINLLGYKVKHKRQREYAFVKEDAVYVPLSGMIKTHYEGKVYNISTNDETFLVSNVVTHNCGARWGKDRCEIMEFIQKFAGMLSEDRGPEMVPSVHGWIIAPVYQLARQVWREFKAYFPREWVRNIWEADKMIETVNDGIIELKSADDPEFLVGVGLDIVLITEAARIAKLDEMWANIETRLMSPGRGPGGKGGLALINSTPRGRNYYYKMYRWGQKGDETYDPDWESWNYPTFDNPHLAKKDLQQIEKMRKRYPERIFNQEILAMFLAEGNSVFPTAEECATYKGDGRPLPGEIYVIGYDPAKSIDHTGVAIRNSLGQCVMVEQWTGVPWTLQLDRIALLSQRYNYATVVIDKTGLGETLPEALTQRGVNVEPVHFTNLIKENMVNHLALLIEQKSICYPELPGLINQLQDYEYTITKTGVIRYSASTSHKHDDLVTALMLAYKDYQTPDLVLPFMGLLGGIGKHATIGSRAVSSY
jgi:hypothetical protein